ncbi:hypothetical protein EVAR_94594_1 [Eumeta japonica]|uniref:Uncharacterized protein n=1 Tax=Eumeta variegata TaxID=151549 RepID=A0A4C1UVE0_EUMVA|nr:hypothetical protein EVAR_94594_1 [Eumeta japonica]
MAAKNGTLHRERLLGQLKTDTYGEFCPMKVEAFVTAPTLLRRLCGLRKVNSKTDEPFQAVDRFSLRRIAPEISMGHESDRNRYRYAIAPARPHSLS